MWGRDENSEFVDGRDLADPLQKATIGRNPSRDHQFPLGSVRDEFGYSMGSEGQGWLQVLANMFDDGVLGMAGELVDGGRVHLNAGTNVGLWLFTVLRPFTDFWQVASFEGVEVELGTRGVGH
jgi:hypothetical protein